jgi:hypothetical protein
MIQYWFGPYSKHELVLSFDNKGAEDMLFCLNSLRMTKLPQSINVVEVNKAETIPNNLVLAANATDDDWLEANKSALKFSLTDESIEYAQFKLREYLKVGAFEPAEFCSFDRAGRPVTTQVYFQAI